MRAHSRAGAVAVILMSLGVVTLHPSPQMAAAAPVVVAELFTSEGCSSCPPADLLLQALADGSLVPGVTVITLSEHVDYWNNLGWRDPFSARAYSDRQSSYAARQVRGQVYTPQLFVDGRTEAVGSDRDEVRNAVLAAAKTPKVPVTIAAARTADGRSLQATIAVRVAADRPLKRPADLLVVVTEDGLATQVKRGENTGRTLSHTGVVRSLTPAGRMTTADRAVDREVAIAWDPAWNAGHARAVVLLQERSSLYLLGAASVPIK